MNSGIRLSVSFKHSINESWFTRMCYARLRASKCEYIAYINVRRFNYDGFILVGAPTFRHRDFSSLSLCKCAPANAQSCRPLLEHPIRNPCSLSQRHVLDRSQVVCHLRYRPVENLNIFIYFGRFLSKLWMKFFGGTKISSQRCSGIERTCPKR